jgi:isoleucyl-tRNA synthetase
MENYDMTRAARIISDFVIDDVSNWYVRRNRRRFWKGEMNDDKLSAYQTLYEVLLTVTKLIAPVVPLVSEDLYLNLRTEEMPESVHLTTYPVLTAEMKNRQNRELENRMQVAQRIVGLARSVRNTVKLKVRQPLARIIVSSESKSVRESAMKMASIIQDEINVKQVEVIEKESDIVRVGTRPLYKKLGPKAGKMMKMVADIIENLNQDTIERLQKQGDIVIDLEGSQIHVTTEDVEFFEEKKDDNFEFERESNILIALDTRMTEELEMEGIAREFVNRVQNLRKDAGFEVTDRITINHQAPEKINNAISKMSDYIKTETLATRIQKDLVDGDIRREIKINDLVFEVALSRN